MRKVVSFLITFLFLFGLASNGQTVLKAKSSKLKVSIELLDTSFTRGDSVKFRMTITNSTKSTQKLLFDKPTNRKYPWSTNAMLQRKSGATVKVTAWSFLSSQLYFENQLKDYYRELKPGKNISHVYYLGDIVRFDNNDATLPKGSYTLQISYDTNLSNKVFFEIK